MQIAETASPGGPRMPRSVYMLACVLATLGASRVLEHARSGNRRCVSQRTDPQGTGRHAVARLQSRV